jgi:hypothetical protein
MSPSVLLELEEKTHDLIHLDQARLLVNDIYALDVSGMTDEQFAVLENIIDKAIQLLSVLPGADHRPLIERLLLAREGVEQGMSPDPSKRPSVEELRAFVAERLS